MASETKIQEEKEEEELSLVSTKVPKARVRFISRVLRRSSRIHVFLFSLCVAQKTNFPSKRWLLFSLCSSLMCVYYITRGGDDSFSLFPLSVFSLRGEDFFERDGDDDRLRRLRQRRSNDRWPFSRFCLGNELIDKNLSVILYIVSSSKTWKSTCEKKIEKTRSNQWWEIYKLDTNRWKT